MCDEQLQDLEDFIQYQFDDIPSSKLAVFLNAGQIQVKTVIGEIEENFIESLISNLSQFPENFHLGNHDFSKNCESSEKLLIYTSESASPRVYATKKKDNVLVVYCCGTTLEKDESRVKELMTDLLY